MSVCNPPTPQPPTTAGPRALRCPPQPTSPLPHNHPATTPQQPPPPQDPELRAAAAALQEALNASSVQEEERLWTVVIDTYGGLDRPWVPDVVRGAVLSWRRTVPALRLPPMPTCTYLCQQVACL